MKKISILLILLLLGIGFVLVSPKVILAYSLNKTSFKYYLPETIVASGSLPASPSPNTSAGFIQTSIHKTDGTQVAGAGSVTTTGGGVGQPYSMTSSYSVPKTSGTQSYYMEFFAVKYNYVEGAGVVSTTETVNVPFTVTEIAPTLTIAANGSTSNISIKSGSQVKITWDVANAISCVRNDTGATIPIDGGSAGFYVYPTATTTYSITCTN